MPEAKNSGKTHDETCIWTGASSTHELCARQKAKHPEKRCNGGRDACIQIASTKLNLITCAFNQSAGCSIYFVTPANRLLME